MGLFSKCSYGNYVAPNPDPTNFRVIRTYTNGRFTAVQLHYPGCTTFNGVKTMVYHTTTWNDLQEQKPPHIDPHFVAKKGSPFARFRGDQYGWQEACEYIDLIKDK